jgi:hypothetical protein
VRLGYLRDAFTIDKLLSNQRSPTKNDRNNKYHDRKAPRLSWLDRYFLLFVYLFLLAFTNIAKKPDNFFSEITDLGIKNYPYDASCLYYD